MKSKVIRIIMFTLLAALIFTYPAAWLSEGGLGKGTATITITAEGIGRGLDPKGDYFDINEIKDEYIMLESIWDAGMQGRITAEELADMISIDPSAPNDAIKRLTSVSGDEMNTAVTERFYYPNKFTVSLEDEGLPSIIKVKLLLQEVMHNYREYLESRYMGLSPESDYDEQSLLQKDYPEIVKIITRKADELIHYIEGYQTQMPEFRSYVGTSFSDLLRQCYLLKDTNVKNMDSLVSYYALTKDADIRKKYERMALERSFVAIYSAQGTARGFEDMVKIYDNSTNYIFPDAGDVSDVRMDGNEEYYGNLTSHLIEAWKMAIDVKYEQDKLQANIAKLESDTVLTGAAYEATKKTVDKDATDTLAKMQDMRKQADMMAKEYYDNYIDDKIVISSPRYVINSWGNPFVNFMLLLAAASSSAVLYKLAKNKSIFDKADEMLKTIRKNYDEKT